MFYASTLIKSKLKKSTMSLLFKMDSPLDPFHYLRKMSILTKFKVPHPLLLLRLNSYLVPPLYLCLALHLKEVSLVRIQMKTQCWKTAMTHGLWLRNIVVNIFSNMAAR
uniref:Uncharacterized protein n=1 Tax=Cacopsylla melanoneura TaxID=428564 RepID=A0A8D9FAK5_9HEMI